MTDDKPERKKAVNGKAKGAGFEQTIVKLLSKTFAPLQFRRSQSSGAILGGKNEVNLDQFSEEAKVLFIGDVVPSNEADVIKAEGWSFRFAIECKFYKEADSFPSLFKNPQVIGWFDQALTDSLKIKHKLPLLIFKFNHTPVFAAFESTVEPPDNSASMLELNYNWKLLDGTTERRSLRIVQLEGLLEHHSWWKLIHMTESE